MAAYILREHGRPMSTMKLQKLCYYSQGWSLAWDSRPMFDEEIQAWANGPVVYELFKQHRGRFTVDAWPSGDPESLEPNERETVNAVLEGYGDLSGQELSDLTHTERPWLEARGGLSAGAWSSRSVDLDVMQDFFGGLDTDRD
ncbi:Panacea domain-containing protein [Agrococcus terreus]|uniref:Panacea domain-containing protein n=1 Tax=Agrococcus terreus TaxID=574649 RepID=UPI001E541980|nr:type II toxin-antitoxin system antitoxin SocA domain-containing protein [Agrococcus terreus]